MRIDTTDIRRRELGGCPMKPRCHIYTALSLEEIDCCDNEYNLCPAYKSGRYKTGIYKAA